ncbi:acetate kinase [Roseovarius sp. LXJ103]|uniref:acetate/propionate family kinase n=1 Tax=Roseovarius carneus TaxID=2853164 RepID=UPI000D608C8C|nr:acetate kinase [Roseovarius carneus]MBZ8117487.1 acetate kinase [Roseovarius carneus]PWE36715.1 acetate kinase [Pelagicola sp. LXJ1103]
MSAPAILVLNTGSSSVKAAVFDGALAEIAAADVTGLGGGARAPILRAAGQSGPIAGHDTQAAILAILHALKHVPVDIVAHRVVHGGAALTRPARLTGDVIEAIEAMVPLAPLHNPPALAGIHAITAQRPDLPQYASFDTAFHADQPDLASTYALPEAQRAAGIRRYGFHGLSYAAMVAQFDTDLPERLLALHLGNGASLCAIHKGRSVANSMGYSPLEGLVMGTRTGSIDAMAVLRLADDMGTEAAARLLNTQSGLLGLAGTNDMRTLLDTDTPEARFAVEHFCYWAARHAGSAIVAMGGLDAIAFTGGIGEHAPQIRDRITAQLALFGRVPVHVIPAAEERQIASDALRQHQRSPTNE